LSYFAEHADAVRVGAFLQFGSTLVEQDELAHVRTSNASRVAPAELAAFVRAKMEASKGRQ
jgi:hypothetical protein